jgi:hypothetical protein
MMWKSMAAALVLGVALLATACDGTDNADGARGSCAAGGQVLGPCDEVETPEDACWKLVDCGVMPVQADPDGQCGYAFDWGKCVGRFDGMDPTSADLAVRCIAASSCDALLVRGSPACPGEAPDCLEIQ